MDVKCPSCGQVTKIPQKHPYHAGFSNRGFLYCDSYPAILEFDVYNRKYTEIVGDKHPWSLSDEEKKRVEESIKPYYRGGKFRFDALPRCPRCNEPLPNLLKDRIHYVEIGEVVDADIEEVWL